MTAVSSAPGQHHLAAPARTRWRGLAIPRDPLHIVLALLTLFSISRVHQFLKLDMLRPALLLFLLAVGLAVLQPRYLRLQGLFRLWPAKVVIALLVFAGIAAPFGISFGGAVMYIVTDFSKVIIFALLLMAAMRGIRDLHLFIWTYVIAAGLLTFMATFVYQLTVGQGERIARLVGMPMYDANDMGLILAVALPLTLLTFQTSKRIGRLVSGAILLGIGVASARSGSRGGFIGLAIVGLGLLFVSKHIALTKRVGFLAVIVVGMAIAAPAGYWERMRGIVNPTQDYNWVDPDGRKGVAKRGFQRMIDNPIFGIGINNFPRAEGAMAKWDRTNPYRGVRWSASHNSYVQAGSELGVPGFILWSSLIFGSMFVVRRIHRRLPKPWARGDPEERFLYFTTLYLPVAMLGFAVTSFFVSFAYLDPLYILVAYVVGVYRAVAQKWPAALTRRGSRGPQRANGWRAAHPVPQQPLHATLTPGGLPYGRGPMSRRAGPG